MNFRFVLHLLFMALPFFYIEAIDQGSSSVILNEETSKHIAQVLRMQNREQLQLTDGKGNLFTVEITDNNKKRCSVTVLKILTIDRSPFNITIAISLIKNSSRFEWFLEKATEIGVTEIIPLICERTEKSAFKPERMKSILISAMLQSQQCWLPVLHEPVRFDHLVVRRFEDSSQLIAYCQDDNTKVPLHHQISKLSNQLICIGPEGDFTKEETDLAIGHHFIPVSLGNTRLRTETAGVVAASLLCLV